MSRDLSEVIGRVVPAPENHLSPELLDKARKARRRRPGQEPQQRRTEIEPDLLTLQRHAQCLTPGLRQTAIIVQKHNTNSIVISEFNTQFSC